MSAIKKKNDKIQSKYIKNYYISTKIEKTPDEEEHAEIVEAEAKPSGAFESKYVKHGASKEIRFDFNITNPIICICIASVIFAVYLLANSGAGYRLGLPNINYYLVLSLPVILYLSRKYVYFSKKLLPVYVALGAFACSIFISFTMKLDYSWMIKMLVMVTPPLTASFIGYSTKCIKYTSYAYIAMSLFFVIDYAVGGITAGWNGNTIGVYTLLGVVWLVFLGAERGKRNIALEIVVFVVSITQMLVTDCRSALASIIVLASFMYLVPKYLMMKKLFFRLVYLIVLLLPLFIVLFYVWLWRSPYAADLDKWSLEQTEKLFFSGREEIWLWVFDFVKEPFFGNGSPDYYGNTHNSFVLLFIQIGYSGYFLLSIYLMCIFEFLHKFFDDHIVRGSFIAFITVYISSAFENIIVDPRLLCLPAFLTLAVGVGRACFLEKQQKEKEAPSDVQYYNTGIRF